MRPEITLPATLDILANPVSKNVDGNVNDNAKSENNANNEILQTTDVEHQHFISESLLEVPNLNK